MNKSRILWSSLSVILIVASILLGACDGMPASLYKTYSLKRGDAAFSFEYPTSYRLVGMDTFGSRDPNRPFKVRFARTKRVRGLTDNFFEITVGGPRIGQALSVVGVNDPVQLERYPTTVAGLSAETLVFSSTGFYSPRTITRVAFLEVDDAWTWVIALRSEEAGADLAKAEFDHIVNTFKMIPDTPLDNQR